MRLRFKYILLLFIICLLAAFLLSSSIFKIKTITVSGNKNIVKEDVIRLSNINYGENIFRINKKKAMKGVFEDSHIKLIKIRTILPDKVAINIIEREPIALVPYVGSYINIDEEGMIIEITPAAKRADLPQVKGMKFNNFKLGEPLNVENKEQFAIMIEIIKELKNIQFIEQTAQIDVTNTNNLLLTTRNLIRIQLGSRNELKSKIAFAKSIVEDVTKKKLKGTIDLSNKGNAVFRAD